MRTGDMYGGYHNDHNDIYAGYNSCVNFLTCHDGFTLYDLYSYNEKHNWNNGWNNQDGANDNRSWNCGVEGETEQPEVNSLRQRMIRNACAVLMCSRGTPMFLAGDEFCNTQYGNNNSYCQDNLISWLNWDMLKENREMFEFFKFMIAFRHRHPVIRKQLTDAVSGMEPLHMHDVHGRPHEIPSGEYTFGVSFAGYDRYKGRDDVVYVAVNAYWEDVYIQLPELGLGNWYLSVNTYGDGHGRYTWSEGEEVRIHSDFLMRPRSVAVFVGRTY